MVRVIYSRLLWSIVLAGVSLSGLTGCPGPGDRMRFDETALVTQQGDNVCFNVPNAQDYQPVDIGINPREAPSKEKHFNFSPGLSVVDESLCIPPSFYHFPDKGTFIVEYVLKSQKRRNEPRSFVITLGINDGHIYNLTPTEREISLPYCRDLTEGSVGSAITRACQR